ncbi:hypothetical protein K5X82_15550 [Halosquirtibacter xylanolyticus]|uniref:hypothetical protein n=1 Tax=Halosquirtibacter xylanolyticus TaxID=3374599 RepID=UPI003747E00B|nr:hypothetical protein K5X82_15550 [Prolixibacteraceae bacterium]
MLKRRNEHFIFILILLFLIYALGSPSVRAEDLHVTKKRPKKRYQELLNDIKNKKDDILRSDSIKQARLDSVWSERDKKALCFYDSLKTKTDKNFFTRQLHDLIIVKKDTIADKKKLNENSAKYFAPYQNKKIRNIRIVYRDIFPIESKEGSTGHSIVKLINDSHVDTKESTVKRNVFFKKGDALSPILMANSEEHLRELPYINSVNIICIEDKDNPNAVDVMIYVQDNFSYGAGMDISSTTEGDVSVYNQNLLGWGHKISLKYLYNSSKKQKRGIEAEYTARNLFSTFADFKLLYANSYEMHQYDAQLLKDFVSSKPQLAMELRYQQILNSNEITQIQSDSIEIHQKNRYVDSWLAKSFNLQNDIIKSHQLILGARFSYFEQQRDPSSNQFYNALYPTKHQILTSFAISKRTSYRANLIYGYGITEDIPIGRYCEIVTGYDDAYNKDRLYLHMMYSQSFQLKSKSYLYFDVYAGGYWSSSQVEQAIAGINMNYFTKLYKIGRYQFRQFINFSYAQGFDRLQYEYLNLNKENGIRDMNSLYVYGKQKVAIQLENVHYHKRAIFGFKFASYAFCDIGAIDNDDPNTNNAYDKYAEIGLGVRIRNESLVFNTFELRLGYFPIVPKDMSQFIYKATSTTKSQFKDFRGRKPTVLPLQ